MNNKNNRDISKLKNHLKKVSFSNFGPFKNESEIDFLADKKNKTKSPSKIFTGIKDEFKPVIGIVGPNSSGKSMIVNFFTFIYQYVSPHTYPANLIQNITNLINDRELPMRISFEIRNEEFDFLYESEFLLSENRLKIKETINFKKNNDPLRETRYDENSVVTNSFFVDLAKSLDGVIFPSLIAIGRSRQLNKVSIERENFPEPIEEIKWIDFTISDIFSPHNPNDFLSIKNKKIELATWVIDKTIPMLKIYGFNINAEGKKDDALSKISNVLREFYFRGVTNEETKKLILEIVSAVDPDVYDCDFSSKLIENEKQNFESLISNIGPSFQGAVQMNIAFSNCNTDLKLPLIALSEGTLNFLALALDYRLSLIVNKNKDNLIFIIDEFGRSWHSSLSKEILSLFSHSETGPTLLVTTHHPEILDRIRDDSIYVIDWLHRTKEISKFSDFRTNKTKFSKTYYDFSTDLFSTIPDLNQLDYLEELLNE